MSMAWDSTLFLHQSFIAADSWWYVQIISIMDHTFKSGDSGGWQPKKIKKRYISGYICSEINSVETSYISLSPNNKKTLC